MLTGVVESPKNVYILCNIQFVIEIVTQFNHYNRLMASYGFTLEHCYRKCKWLLRTLVSQTRFLPHDSVYTFIVVVGHE